MSRAFPTERVQRADVGPPSEVVVIRCSECPSRLEITSKSKERLPADFVIRQADIKGWHVDKLRASHDRCPSCQVAYRRRSTTPGKITPMRPIVAAHHQEPPMSTPVTTKSAPAPAREMSRDDRRIIFAKLNDVYLDSHYSAGWTDRRIAEDLNVPRAWVESVRVENFGDAGDNEDARRFIADLDAIRDDLKAFAVERQTLITRADDIAGRISKLFKIGDEIRKSLTP